jgi:hypothetical protein
MESQVSCLLGGAALGTELAISFRLIHVRGDRSGFWLRWRTN